MPKKILLMGHTDGLGGAQTAYRELFDFVQQEGHELKIINITDRKVSQQPFGSSALLGCIEHKVSGIFKKAKKYVSLLQAGSKAKSFDPDVFVSIGLSNSAIFITKYLGKNCFKIAQDFIANRSEHEEIWIQSRDTFNGIAVQAPSMLKYWQSVLSDPSAVNWLPCFPQPPVAGVIKAPGNRSAPNIKLGYFGRLAGNKGLPLLFKALADLPAPETLTLDLWGKGEKEAELKKLANELKITSRVNFLGGYPDQKEGAELMASYDALVLTSTEMEGLPLVLLESMAYGLPFMATDIGAIADCCINNPDTVLVKPTQENITIGLAVLIHHIQTGQFDPDRLHQYYEDNFSAHVMASRWRECLDNPKIFFS
ncbi:glycosyltransferase [Mucilaginibacter sp. CAU 1740]|uniref:glycosyltransferase n=1 Tax=Mucilaginibacter sp. CAU 1740 TaxID=3140365 RepID=UPI00325B3B0E